MRFAPSRTLLFAVLVIFPYAAAAQAPKIGDPPEAKNMALVGTHDLQARSAYQPLVREQDGRWIAYVGHHGGTANNPLTGKSEANGTSILDVTDPTRPRYLHHLATESEATMIGGEGSGA